MGWGVLSYGFSKFRKVEYPVFLGLHVGRYAQHLSLNHTCAFEIPEMNRCQYQSYEF